MAAELSRHRRRRPRHRPEIATFLSFLWPGLGQAYAGRRLLALVFALPIIALAGLAAYALLQDRSILAFRLFAPGVAMAVAATIVAAGIWRLASMVHANGAAGGDAYGGRPLVVLALLAVVVIGTHGGLAVIAWSFDSAADRIFIAGDPFQDDPPLVVEPSAAPEPSDGAGPAPSGSLPPGVTPAPVPSEELPAETPLVEPPPSAPPPEQPEDSRRLNILITGLDSGPGRSHELTDTLIVVSVDRETREVAMVSFPRDIASFPLFDGRTYRGKINSLLTYARQHPEQFSDPPMKTLARELGHLLGIRVDLYAAINLDGFQRLIDTVGGVTVNNERRIADPSMNFFLDAGVHTLNGEQALAYVRSRKGAGDSDFTRAARQQQVLLGLRGKLTDVSMLPRLPEILDALAGTITTNYPAAELADTIALGQGVDDASVRQYVLGPPYSWHPPTSQTGGSWELRLDLERVAALSVELFGSDSRYAQATGTGTP